MRRSPFRWPKPIDESNPDGGLFFGDSISDRWASREKLTVPSRAKVLEVLEGWFSAGDLTRKVPYLLGPYGIGKTSVLKYAVQDLEPEKKIPLIEIGTHGLPLGSESVQEFADQFLLGQFADRFLAEKFKGDSLKKIQSLVSEFWNPTADPHQLAQAVLECAAVPRDSEPYRIALNVIANIYPDPWLMLTKSILGFCNRPLPLRYLMKACRAKGSDCVQDFIDWIKVQAPPPLVLVYADPTSPVVEELTSVKWGRSITIFDLFERHRVPFLFEWRNLTSPGEDNVSSDTILRRPEIPGTPTSNEKLTKNLRWLRVHALHPEEALDCICGYHTRAQALGGIRQPQFCPKRNAPPDQEMSCPRSWKPCPAAWSVLSQTGTWPLLLQMVCFEWDERYEEGAQKLNACLRGLKPTLWSEVKQWWSTIPGE